MKKFIGIGQPFYATGSANRIADEGYPYSQAHVQPSPLNRPVSTLGAGEAWKNADKKTILQNRLNQGGAGTADKEGIIAWSINNSTGLPENETYIITSKGYHSNMLTLNVGTDDQGNAVREFFYKLGRTFLKNVMVTAQSNNLSNKAHWAEKYCSSGILLMVFAPEAVKALSNLVFRFSPVVSNQSKILLR